MSGVDPVSHSNGVHQRSGSHAILFSTQQTYCTHNSQVNLGAAVQLRIVLVNRLTFW